jgi:hypothetical protein
MKLPFLLLLFASTLANAANPIPASRTPGGTGSWNGLVGVPGGIPARTTIYQSFSPGATTAQIQTAINNCPNGQVVLLNAGTYNIGDLQIGRSNMTLRGAGPSSTIINTPGRIMVGIDSQWWNQFQTPVAANHRAISAGLTQGSTVITVSSTSGMTVGNLIFIDQLNDADTTAFSPVNPSGPYATGEYTSVAHPLQGYDRIQFQINRIAAINGNQVTLTEPIYMPNWNMGLSPQAWFQTGMTLVEGTGVEDLAINTTSNGGCIYFQYTYGCWVKNTSLSLGTAAHFGYIFPLMSVRPEIRHNYLHDTGIADRYGIHTRMVAGALVTDNICNGHGTMLMVNGVSGSVYSYNYDRGVDLNGNGQFMTAGILTHGGTPNMCLFEGNYAPEIQQDTQWQNSSYITGLRNRLTGQQLDQTKTMNNVQAIAVMEMHRHSTYVGNVLGTTGRNTWYQDDGATAGNHENGRVWFIGTRGPGKGGIDPNYDPQALATLIRVQNWDSAHGSVFDANGYVIWDVPDSLYLTGKPAFFGNLAWPAFNPSSPTLGPEAIPAGYRFINGVDPAPTPTPTPTPTSSYSARGTGDR